MPPPAAAVLPRVHCSPATASQLSRPGDKPGLHNPMDNTVAPIRWSKTSVRRRQVGAAFLLAALLFGNLVRPAWADSQATENPSSTSGVAALQAAIQARLAAAGGEWSVSVGVPGVSEAAIALNADRQVIAASLFKLVLLVEALRQQRAGEFDFNERLEMTPRALSIIEPLPSTLQVGETMVAAEAVERMVTISSNTGAVLVGERIGWIRAQRTVEQLGLDATSMYSPPKTTATDMQRLLRIIAGEPADPQLLHPDDAAHMLRLMADQRINDRVPPELFRAGLIAHKTGDLALLLHDAGLITGPSGPIAVVLMATDFPSRRDAVAAMVDVYRLVYQAAEVGAFPAAIPASSAASPPAPATPVPDPTPRPTQTGAAAVPTATAQTRAAVPQPIVDPIGVCEPLASMEQHSGLSAWMTKIVTLVRQVFAVSPQGPRLFARPSPR